MSIYHICTDCPENTKNTSTHCLAWENPYDTRCIKHEQFMRLEMQKRNRQYYRVVERA